MNEAKKRIDRIEKQLGSTSDNRVDSWDIDGLSGFIQIFGEVESGQLVLTEAESERLHERFGELIDNPRGANDGKR